MAKVWKFHDFVKPDASEDRLRDEIAQLSSSIPCDKSAIRSAKENLLRLMAEHRGINPKKLNPASFAEYLKSRICAGVFFGAMHLYNYNTGIYEAVPEDTVKGYMKSVLDELGNRWWSISYENSYYTAFCRLLVTYREVGYNPEYLLFTNGILHLQQMQLYNHTPNIARFTNIPYDYDATATAPKFLATVDDIFNGHKPTIDNLQEMFGYLLYYGKNYPLQKLFVFYGTGRNGKGVISNCITMMLGEKNCSAVFADELQERFGRQNIYNKMANISPEKSNMKPMETAYIKSLTGGDTVEIEQKYKDSFSTKIYTKFIICTNQMLTTYDTSHGFFSRLVIFPFENTYVEVDSPCELPSNHKPMDKELIEHLKKERAGIMNWALQGLLRLRNNNWNMTANPKISSLKTEFQLMTNPVSNFVHSCIEQHTDSRIKTSEMYDCFKAWAISEDISIYGYDNRRKFRELLIKACNDAGINVAIVKNNVEYYSGIALTDEGMTCYEVSNGQIHDQ